MIRVTKPSPGPAMLVKSSGRGIKETRILAADYDSGKRSFKFKSGIYGAKSVKNALIKAQHGKCVFCESKIRHVSHGDVEHFRPKGGFKQTASDALTQPGYYWLAYAWANLFLSCQICNQRFKGSLFPLLNPSRRARSHHDDLAAERPVFIHPVDDDPIALIGFRQEYAFPINGNRRAKATIESLGLNRTGLVELRRSVLEPIRLLMQFLTSLEHRRATGEALTTREREILDDAGRLLGEHRADSAQYASMLRSMMPE